MLPKIFLQNESVNKVDRVGLAFLIFVLISQTRNCFTLDLEIKQSR